MAEEQPLTIAVTGPTGEVGMPFVRAAEAAPEIGRIRAMARRPFDPAEFGWEKTEYRQGDILDREAVDDLVADVDVVVHLAFIVVEATVGSHDINVVGSRNVFQATAAAGVPRLVYTSSVAAYGYPEVSGPLTEDVEARGTDRHAYSQQKAEVERALAEALAGSRTEAYVFRPCVVAGPDSPALIEQLPYVRFEHRVPSRLRALLGRLPGVRPVLPDHGVPLQLVHHDDVAAALLEATLGRGAAGVYNLAAEDTVTISDIAGELGWHSVPVPRMAVNVTATALRRVPPLSVEAGWLEAIRKPMLMDCSRARGELGWKPAYSTRETLRDLVAARKPR